MSARGIAGTLALAALLAGPSRAQVPAVAGEGAFSLRRALEVALRQSLVLQQSRQGLRVAEQQVREAYAAVLPDISGSASYDRNLRVQEAFLPAVIFDPNAPPDELIPVRFGSDNIWTARVAAEQPLFQLDVLAGLGAARRYRSLQTEGVRGSAQNVVTAVRQAYFDALLATEELRLSELSLERVRQTLAETEALNRAGMASSYDVLRLQVQEANLEPALRRATIAAVATRRTLLVEMGLDPSTPIELEGELHQIDLEDLANNAGANAALLASAGGNHAPDQAASLESTALADRSDLRQVRLNVSVEEARLAAQRAEYFPKLSLFSSYTLTAQQNGGPDFFGSGSNQRTTAAVLGLRVEVPIFQGFARDARMQQTRARMRQLGAREERLEQEAASQVRTLVDQLEESRSRAVAQRRAVAQASRGFEIASAEYRAGVGSQLQITDAELALRQSEFNYAQAVYDYLTTRAQLEAASGAAPSAVAELAAAPETRD